MLILRVLLILSAQLDVKPLYDYMQDGWYDERPHSFQLYAPCRTAVVYALVENKETLPIKG